MPGSGRVAGAHLCAAHKKHAESLINRMEHGCSCLDTQHVTPEAINSLTQFSMSPFLVTIAVIIIIIIIIDKIYILEIKAIAHA